MNEKETIALQRAYYTETAEKYDSMHINENTNDMHELACSLLHGIAVHYKVKSILDIGSGTGRVILNIQNKLPEVRIIGIEPVSAMREMAYRKGISRNNLLEGDATKLEFENDSFDLVCGFGVLHHIPNPRLAVEEMLRVAQKAIFIYDQNLYGQGSNFGKFVKFFSSKLKLWKIIKFIITKGKGYNISSDDGISFYYSVFDDFDFIKKKCKKVMVFNFDGNGKNTIKSAGKIGLLGII